MKEKRNIHELIVKEEPHLNEILDPAQVSKFKELTNELRDTWTKKQMFRTKTEMEFSVLNDAKYPTNAAKYWQCVREQNTHMENLMQLSFEARKNDIEIKQKLKELDEETDPLEKELIQVDIDQKTYSKANMQLVASHRMREVTEWSNFKKIYNDGTFDDKNVDTHQLLSYKKIMKNRQNTLTPGSSQPEVFNVLGQMQSIERIEEERKLLVMNQRKLSVKHLNTENNLKFKFIWLGQTILQYQVPLDIFNTINKIYETNFVNLPDAHKQLVGKIKKENSLFYGGVPTNKMHPHNVLPSYILQWFESVFKHYLEFNKIYAYKLSMQSIWINEMTAGEYNPIHIHQGSIYTGLSSVMMLKLPKDMGPESAKPEMPTNGRLSIIGSANGQFVKSDYSPNTKERDFYIFPYDMRHCVYPHNFNAVRRTLAANMDVNYNPVSTRTA